MTMIYVDFTAKNCVDCLAYGMESIQCELLSPFHGVEIEDA